MVKKLVSSVEVCNQTLFLKSFGTQKMPKLPIAPEPFVAKIENQQVMTFDAVDPDSEQASDVQDNYSEGPASQKSKEIVVDHVSEESKSVAGDPAYFDTLQVVKPEEGH